MRLLLAMEHTGSDTDYRPRNEAWPFVSTIEDIALYP
jgi:hypothetical protein